MPTPPWHAQTRLYHQSPVFKFKAWIETNPHLCLAGWWQSQHSGLSHWQPVLTVLQTMGHVSPLRVTKGCQTPDCSFNKQNKTLQTKRNIAKYVKDMTVEFNTTQPLVSQSLSICTWREYVLARTPMFCTNSLVNRVLHYRGSIHRYSPSLIRVILIITLADYSLKLIQQLSDLTSNQMNKPYPYKQCINKLVSVQLNLFARRLIISFVTFVCVQKELRVWKSSTW